MSTTEQPPPGSGSNTAPSFPETANSVAETVSIDQDESQVLEEGAMSEIPIETADYSASMPDSQELRVSVAPRTSSSSSPGGGKSCRNKCWIAMAVIVLVAIIVGVAVGVTMQNPPSSGSSSNKSSSGNPEPRQSTTSQVIEYLVTGGVSSRADLENPGTPQNSAAKWLADLDDRNTVVPEHDINTPVGYHYATRYVLALLWYGTYSTHFDLTLLYLSFVREETVIVGDGSKTAFNGQPLAGRIVAHWSLIIIFLHSSLRSVHPSLLFCVCY